MTRVAPDSSEQRIVDRTALSQYGFQWLGHAICNIRFEGPGQRADQ